jgi:D-alanyl-D-alanine carboxypeptidase (penicillin-binding protein 5/6)
MTIGAAPASLASIDVIAIAATTSAMHNTTHTVSMMKHRTYSTFLLAALYCLVAMLLPANGTAATTPSPPQIAARAHVLMDLDSGMTLAEQAADTRLEPASLTKLMTAYVVFGEIKANHIALTDMVTISEKAWRMPGSRTFVEVGKQVNVQDLLLGMIVQSGNDASLALAEHVGGSEEVFINLMNQRAQVLGMRNTHFVNSTGMPDEAHYSSARDLAILARAIIHDFPEYYRWYSQREFTYNGITQQNRNLLLWRDSTVDGVKTGHTESAGYCLVSSALRDGMRLISVVLGTKSENARAEESRTLLNFGFRFYQTHRLYADNESLAKVRVWKGDKAELPLGLSAPLYVTIPRGDYANLQASVNLPPRVEAPVAKGQQLGSVSVTLAGAPVAERPLTALEQVNEGGLFGRMIDEVLLMFQ